MILIGLGSNMGDRDKNLERALRLLEQDETIELDRISGIYESAPYGVTDQADFLNMVAVVVTMLSPFQLLDRCLAAENALGRLRTRHWGPRIIDIDLLAYDQVELTEPALTLPHPGLFQRAFVLAPLLEIMADDWVIAGRTKQEVAASLAKISGQGIQLWKRVHWDSVKKCFA
jgi:2-amino-4-hydroxy-6-hydroxymethyldihydropteridine diphosphokinase